MGTTVWLKTTGLLEVVYAPDTVQSMLPGKAVARAMRSHSLVQTTFCAELTSMAFGDPLSSAPGVTEIQTPSAPKRNKPNSAANASEATSLPTVTLQVIRESTSEDLKACLKLYDRIPAQEVSAKLVVSCQELMPVEIKLNKVKEQLICRQTPCPWLQYMYLDMLQ